MENDLIDNTPPKVGIIAHFHPLVRIGFYLIIAGTCVSLLSILAMAFIIPLYGNVLGGGWMNNLDEPNVLNAMKIMQLFNAIGLFVVPAFLFSKLDSNSWTRSLSFNQIDKKGVYGIVILMVVCALPIINWMAEINGVMQLPEFLSGVEHWMRDKENEAELMTKAFLSMDSFDVFLINLVIVAIIPAVGEELMFRSVIQGTLHRWIGNAHIAIWISAFLFSAMHGQFFGFFPRMILGAMLGYLFYWSGNIWMPILAHFVNNGLAVLMAYLSGIGFITEDLEAIGSDGNMLLAAVTSLIISTALLYLIRRKSLTEFTQ